MRVSIRRTGGIAGVAMAAELDTAQLPAVQAGRLEAALTGLPWGGPPALPPHPDAFSYEVALPEEPDRGTAVLPESRMEGDLAVLREHVQQAGAPVSRRRPGG